MEQKQSDLMLLMTEIIEYGKYSLDMEVRREESIISQAGQMLTTFSFSTAALYLLFQIALDKYPVLSNKFLIISVGSITVLLMVSLFSAMLSLWRWKRKTMKNMNKFFEHVRKYQKKFLENDYAFLIEWEKSLGDIHEDLFDLNNRRGILLKLSMGSFFTALIVSFISGICAVIIIKGGF
jgi:hypothetical protein